MIDFLNIVFIPAVAKRKRNRLHGGMGLDSEAPARPGIFAGYPAPRVLLSRQLNEPASLPQPDRDRSLGEACNDLAGRLCPSGPNGEIDEWSVYDETFRRVVRWAEDKECFFEGLQPLKEGGRDSVGYADSLAFVREDVAVFDLRPANVVKTDEGLIIPIDAIPYRLDDRARAILGD